MAYTLEKMVEELWERTGEPSDMDPYDADGNVDLTSEGWTKMTGALNRAVVTVATFRDPQTGRMTRLRDRHAWQYPAHEVETDALTADVAKGAFQLQFAASGVEGQLVDHVVKVGTEVRTIIADDGAGTCTVGRGFGRAHVAGEAVKFAPRFVTLDVTTTKFVEIHSVYNLTSQSVVTRGERGDVFNSHNEREGTPRTFYRVGDRLYFDNVSLDEEQHFRVDYLRLPPEMTVPTDTTNLPEAYDEAVVMWAVGWGFGRVLDPKNRAAARSEFVAEMRMRQSEWHVQNEGDQDVGAYLRSY